MEEQFIRNRITDLRMKKNVSERKMSLDLGHSTSYIHSIVSGRALPSLAEFLYLCEYLEITPMEFFNTSHNTSTKQQKALQYIYDMHDDDVELLIRFIERMNMS